MKNLIDRNKPNKYLDELKRKLDEYRNSISPEDALCILITIPTENTIDNEIVRKLKIFHNYHRGGYYEGIDIEDYTINKIIFNRLYKINKIINKTKNNKIISIVEKYNNGIVDIRDIFI